jgi:hypothetical protein
MKIKTLIVLSAFIPVIVFAQTGIPNVGSQNQVGAPNVPSAINAAVTTTQSSSVNGSGNTNLNGSYGNTNIQGSYGNTNIQGSYGNTSVANSGNTDIKGSGNTAIASGNGNTTVIVIAPESK